ncbi:DUF676-domain-containing protein [Xylariomycetidae sp. FL2044]|nr:DUF676-domain-containing protein [Xylariomycetidae sp. FL2044]
MLLLNQIGSVKCGEVIRYTVTYTPSNDRILPSPEVLHLRLRNTSPIPLRAAFVHGPYTLSVSAVPSHYDPNVKFENPRRYGIPEFEPMLKAGGTWTCQLIVPDNIRESAGMGAARGNFDYGAESSDGPTMASWVIEIASQVIFSNNASVGYEVLLARDEKSLNLGSSPVIGGQAQVAQPGKVSDLQQSIGAKDGHHPAQPKGVFSKAITLKVEDTASLWNTPQLPGWDDTHHGKGKLSGENQAGSVANDTESLRRAQANEQRGKKIHLVVLTHGLHSNLGADMLYMKESIDATARRAKTDARARRAQERANSNSTAAAEDEYDDEEVVVRGYSGNATRTERGIKFLGKRLAHYVLAMTYPDQPFLPAMKKASESIANAIRGETGKDDPDGHPAHKHSSVHKGLHHDHTRKFQVTSISFVGHSLGGLIQTYAIAYIQKHSPRFFDLIRPINFITLAAPLLGLSNENPLYVRIALDSGLVGRTGQDLGLTWRAPTVVRSGWGAIVGSLGESAHKKMMGEVQPESKPLLRILPTGPAHMALKKFRNRTVYSNVVNDGIVPLRTSCLLFLDWQGLGRVQKARREAGLVETVVGFGWAELTGANASSRREPWAPKSEEPPMRPGLMDTEQEDDPADPHVVPQPPTDAIEEDDRRSLNLATPHHETGTSNSHTNNDFPFSGFFNFFKSSEKSDKLAESSKQAAQKTPPRSPKEHRIYQRSQTLKVENSTPDSASSSKTQVSSGQELDEDQGNGVSAVSAPPRTTFLESAGDILNPKMPSVEYLLDPSKRPRTIFHDRVYHPSDIPPPPLKKRSTGSLGIRRKSRSPSGSSSSRGGEGHLPPQTNDLKVGVKHEDTGLSARDYDDASHTDPSRNPGEVIDTSSMKVEEKIARAYHRDLSWRKVLVKLEPDAHNNIIVRRTFANAHGWPVVKHLCDAHFSDSAAARTRDENEDGGERAKAISKSPDSTGAETRTQHDAQPSQGDTEKEGNSSTDRSAGQAQSKPVPSSPGARQFNTSSDALEATDAVPDLPSPSLSKSMAPHSSKDSPPCPPYDRNDSASWSDRDFADSGDESDLDLDLAYGRHHTKDHGGSSQEEKGKDIQRTTSPVWNWTEKIVGKSATKKGKSPMSPTSPSNPGESQAR